MTEYEQKGYDAWIALWVLYESAPTLSMCPARRIEDANLRMQYLHGWRKAKEEHEKEQGG